MAEWLNEYGTELEMVWEETEDMGDNTVWVSYFLQDGTTTGTTLEVEDRANAYNEICEFLREEHGEMFGDIADYGFYEEV